MCYEYSPDLHSNLLKSIACKDRLWLLLFRLITLYFCVVFWESCFSSLVFLLFLAAVHMKYENEDNMLIYTATMKYKRKCYLPITCVLLCSLGFTPESAMNSPKAISLFLIEPIHTWSTLLKDMGPRADHLVFALCAVDALLKSSLPSQPIASFLSRGSSRGHSPHRCPRTVGPDPKTVPHASSSQMTSGRS